MTFEDLFYIIIIIIQIELFDYYFNYLDSSYELAFEKCISV